jgi:hypothetical protein
MYELKYMLMVWFGSLTTKKGLYRLENDFHHPITFWSRNWSTLVPSVSLPNISHPISTTPRIWSHARFWGEKNGRHHFTSSFMDYIRHIIQFDQLNKAQR